MRRDLGDDDGDGGGVAVNCCDDGAAAGSLCGCTALGLLVGCGALDIFRDYNGGDNDWLICTRCSCRSFGGIGRGEGDEGSW